ncbi:hypothetical protein [Actinospica sp.]|jgi:hypothetical protein|uniref:hypothetical protein n=1 Tax=Actinospica sp. TaxID=1872142 RepID=UPI002C27CADA|nr:hypothetical protein [Actinospica sp.]HWG27453.1 hypothetical protein [Actinospica sp.]
MEHALAQIEPAWRAAGEAASAGIDDLAALRQALVQQVLFSAAHPQVMRIMNHEGAIDGPRVRFVVDRFINTLRPGIESLLTRLAAAGRIHPLPYATLHYLAVAGTGAIYANPVEAALLGAPAHPGPREIRAHAETVADLLIAGIKTQPEHIDP